MTNKTRLLNNKAGFTLIELIVVMSILGILVLLGAPMYLGYTERANLTHIRHDVAVTEGKMEELLSEEDGYTLLHAWHNVDEEALSDDILLYDKENRVEAVDIGEYKRIPEQYIDREVRSNLKGSFYTTVDGFVLYSENDLNTSPPISNELTEKEIIETIGEYIDERFDMVEFVVWTADTPDEFEYITFDHVDGAVPWSNRFIDEDGTFYEDGPKTYHDGIFGKASYLYRTHHPWMNYYMFGSKQFVDSHDDVELPSGLSYGDIIFTRDSWVPLYEYFNYSSAAQNQYIPSHEKLGTLQPLFYEDYEFSYPLNIQRNRRTLVTATPEVAITDPNSEYSTIIMFPLNAGIGTDILEHMVKNGPLENTDSLNTQLFDLNPHLDKMDIVHIDGQDYMVVVNPHKGGFGELDESIIRNTIFYNIFRTSTGPS